MGVGPSSWPGPVGLPSFHEGPPEREEVLNPPQQTAARRHPPGAAWLVPVKGRAAPRRLEAEPGSRSCKEPIPASPVVSLMGLPLLDISSHGHTCLRTSAQPHYTSQEDNNRGTGKAWGHHRHCQGGILVLLLGAHSLSPQEDPKWGHFRLRGKENRDSSHNPRPLGNSSETVQQQQQGKAHQGRP